MFEMDYSPDLLPGGKFYVCCRNPAHKIYTLVEGRDNAVAKRGSHILLFPECKDYVTISDLKSHFGLVKKETYYIIPDNFNRENRFSK